jgi:hypothetical protein
MTSSITGSAPIIEILNYSGPMDLNTFNDEVAIRHLLNITNSLHYNYTSIEKSKLLVNGTYPNITEFSKKCLISTSTNKSLFIFDTENVTGVYNLNVTSINSSNLSVVNTFNISNSSDIVRGETFFLRVESADNGVIYSDNASFYLVEREPSNQNDINALNDIRILNAGNLTASFSFDSSAVDNALGVEGKVFYFPSNGTDFEPNYKDIVGYDPMSNHNISLSIDKTGTSYDNEILKIDTYPSYFNFTTSNDTKVVYGSNLAFGNNVSLAYNSFIPVDYTTTLGNVGTSSISLSATTSASRALEVSSNPGFVSVDPTFIAPNDVTNLSVLKALSIGDTINMTLVGAERAIVGADLPVIDGENAIDVTPITETIPSGVATSSATITFDSSDRYTYSSQNGYSISASITYNVDGNGTGLDDVNMTTESVSCSFERLANNTDVKATDAWLNNDNIDLYYDVTGINVANASEYISLTDVTNEPNKSYAVKLYPSNAITLLTELENNATNQLVQLGTNTTVAAYVEVVADQSQITSSSYSDANDWRILIDPQAQDLIDSVNTSSIYNIHTLNLTSGTISISSNLNVLNYDANDNNGPVDFYADYYDFGTNDYVQTYECVFPNVRNLGSNNRIQKILLEGYTNFDKTGDAVGNGGYTIDTTQITYKKQSDNSAGIDEIITGPVDGVETITVKYIMEFDISLTGISNGTFVVCVPVEYSYTRQRIAPSTLFTYSWNNGTVPQLRFDIRFDLSKFYPHRARLQYKTGEDTWISVNDVEENRPYIDLRLPREYISVSDSENNASVTFKVWTTELEQINPVSYKIDLKVSKESDYKARVIIFDNDDASEFVSNSLSSLKSMLTTGTVVDVTETEVVREVGEEDGLILGFSDSGNSFNVNLLKAPLDKEIYLLHLHGAVIKTTNTQGDVVNVIRKNGGTYTTDNGIEVTFVNVEDQSANGSMGAISLNNDKYSAIMYDGQTGASYQTLGAIPNSLVLVPHLSGDSNNTTTIQLDSSIYRGYKHLSSYTISRDTVDITAKFGDYEETISISPAPGTLFTFNFADQSGHNFGFRFKLDNTSNSNQYIVFDVIRNEFTLTYSNVGQDVVTETVSSYSSLELSDLFAHPFVDLLYMKNFFIPGGLALGITYTQPAITIQNSTTYIGRDNTQSASSFISGLSWSSLSTISDEDIVTSADQIIRNYTLGFDTNAIHRTTAHTFYLTTAPVYLSLSHRINSGSVQSRYIMGGGDVDIPVNGNTAKYTFESSVSFNTIRESFSAFFDYKPNLFTLENSESSPYTYLDKVDITEWSMEDGYYVYDFAQKDDPADPLSYNFNDESNIRIRINNAYFRPKYDFTLKFGYHNSLTIASEYNARITAYNLSYEMDGTTLRPVVYKYQSINYTNEVVNPADDTIVRRREFVPYVDGDNKKFLLKSSINPGFSYRVASNTRYPLPSSFTGSVIASSSDIAPSELPSTIDLLIRLQGKRGVQTYLDVMNPKNNVLDVIKVDAKDQFIVKDFCDNLSMRVGPNGRLYTGDVSLYSLAVYESNNNSINSQYIPIYNSNVALGNAGIQLGDEDAPVPINDTL